MSSPDADTFTTGAVGAVDRAQVREQLWGAVIDCDEYAAAATIYAAMDAGAAPEDVLLDVITPVQRKIGAEWAANWITTAQEHAATAINDRVIAALAHHPATRTSAQSGKVTVALSCSIPTRLPTAHAAITACQAAGVAAFGADGRYARQLGADAWAPDARAAAEMLGEGFLSTHLSSARQPVDDLPHLSDQEYTTVSQTSAHLVQETMASLEAGIPAMRDYTELQHQRTAEDVASIVDFLVAGLYTDDDALFTGISWTADILTARGLPAETLFPALELLGKQLHEFPRSQRLLNAALSALAGEKSPATDPTY